MFSPLNLLNRVSIVFVLGITTLSAGHTSIPVPSSLEITARSQHRSTLLENGDVLISGGDQANGGLSSAELFVEQSETVVAVSNMVQKRFVHQATRLSSGAVLLTGGYNSQEGFLNTAEVYDPIQHKFFPAGAMIFPRDNHRDTLLQDGNVLITGGSEIGNYWASAELYDLPTGKFVRTGDMSVPRLYHTATRLRDGRVLIAGGISAGSTGKIYLASAELYDPLTRKFSPTGLMGVARAQHEAALLDDGRVLITGGTYDGRHATRTAEVFDPSTGSFSAVGNMSDDRWVHAVASLPNGSVLVSGGLSFNDVTSQWSFLSSVDLFLPREGKFVRLPAMKFARALHEMTVLKNGTVLVTGGHDRGTYISTVELFRKSYWDVNAP